MTLAVIVPVHNEGPGIRPLYERVKAALEALPGLTGWSLVFANNASDDHSLDEIVRLHAADPRVKVITLARDFGYHAALVAGLSHIDSELYAILEADGQDPPELLADFYAAITKDGAQIAYGVRSHREEPAFVMGFRRLFYALNKRIADSDVIMWMAEFAMITRSVREAILTPRTTYPFLRTEIAYVGFKRIGIPYYRTRRRYGASHYNFWNLTKFAIGGFLSSSTFPLRLVLYLAAVLAVSFPLAVVLLRLSLDEASQLATVCALYFLLGTLPWMAIYLARTYKNGVARPVYVVDQERTFV